MGSDPICSSPALSLGSSAAPGSACAFDIVTIANALLITTASAAAVNASLTIVWSRCVAIWLPGASISRAEIGSFGHAETKYSQELRLT